MFYSYVAIDPRGGKKQGSLEGASMEAVRHQLKASGFEPVTIKEDYVSLALSYLPFSKKRLSNNDIVEFLSFLADFLGSGMDMRMALENLENVMGSKKSQGAVSDIKALITKGSSLSDAMKRTGYFPDLIHAGVYAGEQAGELVKALRTLEDGVRQTIEFTYEVRKAVTYPAVIISMVFIVIGIYLIYVVPKVRGIIEMTGYTPTPTKILFAVMDFVRTFWWALPPGIVTAVIGLKQMKSHLGDEKVELMIRSLPLFGPVLATTSITRTFFTLNLLLKAGMNIKDALSIAASSETSGALRNALLKVRDGIVSGKPVSASFRLAIFPQTVSKMLEVGEKAGLLEQYTRLIAAFYRKYTERQLKKLTTIMEPLMLVIAAGFILLLFFGFIMPIYQSIMSLSGGMPK